MVIQNGKKQTYAEKSPTSLTNFCVKVVNGFQQKLPC